MKPLAEIAPHEWTCGSAKYSSLPGSICHMFARWWASPYDAMPKNTAATITGYAVLDLISKSLCTSTNSILAVKQIYIVWQVRKNAK